MPLVFRLNISVSIFGLVLSGCLPKVGANDNTSDVKIVNGFKAEPTDPIVKYTTAIVTGQGQFFCSAVLITPSVLVTAAHCLKKDLLEAGIKISFGVRAFTGTKFDVATAFQHPNYNPNASVSHAAHDIGLIVLKKSVPKEIGEPIEVADNFVKIIPYTTQVLIAGYGVTGTGASDGGYLRYTETLTAIDDPNTKEVILDSLNINNACDGDSGGPALIEDLGVIKAIGTASYVISGGVKSCESGLSAYTDLRKYRSWIDEEIAKIPRY